ncbi:hypothetical protein [Polaribacter sp. Hel_I_88]|uniref:hypothetical protein n=1 Tax=Polaribacter sp. Hel_I_88 TaxID=1250006 RepID=UPI0004799901|nr:hypothetical protein [Polaribacter sp. Hel_I_88]
MKKGILILLGMFMMVSTTEANDGKILSSKLNNETSYNVYDNYNNAVNFFERGIEFFVFTNGEFDFDTRFNNRGIRINRDFRGRITNVGNVFIRYDRRGNVTRIGSVLIRYSRGLLTNVGDLRVRYNHWNTPVFYGNVRNFYYNNGIRFNVSFGDVCEYNDAYFFRNDFGNNYHQFREDNNFYYYRARPNANIGKRSTILKRRKPVVNNRQTFVRNHTNSYRKATSNNRATSNRSASNTYRNGNQNSTIKRNSSANSRNATTSRNSETRRKATTDKKVDRKRNEYTRNNNSENTTTRRRGSI